MGAIESSLKFLGEVFEVIDHADKGGCGDQFIAVMRGCYPRGIEGRRANAGPAERVVDKEACARAEAALRKCIAGCNSEWFDHQFVARMEHLARKDLSLEEGFKKTEPVPEPKAGGEGS